MNEIPALPPSQKPTPWKIIIPVALVILLCCCCLVVIGVLAYQGTQGDGPLSMLATATPTRIPTKTPTPTLARTIYGDWDLYYDWDCTGSYNGPATLTFYLDGTYYAYENDNGGYGTWVLKGDVLDYIYDTYPYANYIGTLNSTMDYLEGTMSTTEGSTGCFYAMKR